MAEPFPLLHDPPEPASSWSDYIPILGWMAAYWRQLDSAKALVQQAVTRGPVSEAAWEPYRYNREIRSTIEKIVIENAYPIGSTFHPLDPVELMFVWRYGDLNEMQILMDIEDQLGFEFDRPLLERFVLERTTFVEFIGMVETARDADRGRSAT